MIQIRRPSMLDVRILHTPSPTRVTGRVYALVDPDGVIRYIGSTLLELGKRMSLHRTKETHDGSASPLLRYVNARGGFDGWTIREVATITYDPTLNPDALKDTECAAIKTMRTAGHPLLNKNSPKCQNQDRREYMRQWRQRNPGYMARKGREHRERRRVAALAAKAELMALEPAMQSQDSS
jgi:hypothetical protein